MEELIDCLEEFGFYEYEDPNAIARFLTPQLHETIQQSLFVKDQDKPKTLESFYSEYF
ncbi:MAG: hypothetical protein MUD14_02435 [Hydrococcus sp. Prado102]|jgi:hypothetical protein|nr:hypothetical protein [Hydrococcus sp. Prado102]